MTHLKIYTFIIYTTNSTLNSNQSCRIDLSSLKQNPSVVNQTIINLSQSKHWVFLNSSPETTNSPYIKKLNYFVPVSPDEHF